VSLHFKFQISRQYSSGAYIFRPAADNTIDIGSNQNFFKTMIHNYHQGSFDARPYLFTTARS
jgi:hypothetical protein